MGRKICIVCKTSKKIDQFYKNRRSKDGRMSCCIECRKVFNRSDANKLAQKRFRQSDKGKAAQKKHNSYEARKAYQKEYEKTEVRKRIKKRYALSNKRKAAQKRYRQSSKGKAADKKGHALRRAKKTQAGGSYTTSEWFDLCKFYGFLCLKCDDLFPSDELTVDHVKPISKGGTSFIHNLQPLCLNCNRIKGIQEIDYRKSIPSWVK